MRRKRIDAPPRLKKLLLLVPLPPPLHGSNLMNEYVVNIGKLNNFFHMHVLPIRYVSSIEEIGRINVKKGIIFLELLVRLIIVLIRFHPNFVYFVPAVTGMSFFRDYLFSLVIKAFGCRIIYHLHGKGIKERARNPIERRIYKSFFRKEFIILLSRLLFDDVSEVVREDQVAYLPNGILVGENRWKSVEAHPEREKTHILFLGNLMLSKGPLVLLEGATILKEKGCLFTISIVGNPSNDMSLDSYEALIKARGLQDHVFVLGPRYGEEKLNILTQSDILVFPTANDCFPLTLLEAMSQGLPVISTFEGAIPEIVDDGVTGFLVRSADASALAERIAYLIDNRDERLRMGAAGKKKFEEKYRLDIFEAKFVEVIAGFVSIESAEV